MDEELRTIWCGNLSERVTEELLYELFLQAAPLESVRIPKDKNGRRSNYGFVVVRHEVSVDYVVELLNGTALFDRRITVKKRERANVRPMQPPGPELNFDQLLMMGQMMHFERRRFEGGQNRRHDDRRRNAPYNRNQHNRRY